MANGVARALAAARLCPRRPRRHPLRQPRRISRGLFRHHARRPGRGAGEFQVSAATPSISSCGMPARSWCSATRAPADCPAGPSVRAIRRRWTRRLRPLPRPRPVRRRRAARARAGDVPLHLGLDRHAERRRALAPEPHLGGRDAACARPRSPPLSDRRAALSHERAGAEPSSPAPRTPPSCCCRNSRRRAYIEAIERYRCTWLTAVPPMIAMMLREKELLARTDLSSVEFVRMGSAPVSHSLMEAIHRRAAAGCGDQCLRHDRSRPGRVRPASRRPAAAGDVGRLSASARSQLRLVDGDNRDAEEGVLEMNCPAVMNGYHNRPDIAAAVHAPTASTSPATCSGATATAFTISSGAPTTCSSRAARTSIRPMSSACSSAIPPSRRRPSCRSTTRSRDRSRWPSWCRSPASAERRRDQALRARQRAGLCASALRLVRRRAAARLDQQDRPGVAAPSGAGARRHGRE